MQTVRTIGCDIAKCVFFGCTSYAGDQLIIRRQGEAPLHARAL